MARMMIDIESGCFRPFWTNMNAIGYLAFYFDMHDKRSAEEQLISGYEGSAGTSPYPMTPEDWEIGAAGLHSLKYDEYFEEVSRCTAPDGATVIMFAAALTAVVRDGKIVWLARLD